MKRYLLAILVGFLTILPFFVYIYLRGRVDGVRDYKHSKQFQMTLESQYRFGCHDGLSGQCHSGEETPH